MIYLDRIAIWVRSLTVQSEIDAPSSSEIDPAWHGDHWQNLLASPLDARRYVTEDWTAPLDGDLVR